VAEAASKVVWAGRVVSGLLAALYIFSGVMKLKGGPDLEEGFNHLGLPATMATPLGIVELACAAAYVIPQTAILGAVLLTGYMGGAICTHWRVGDSVVPQIVIGLLVWLGVYLREPRLHAVLPVRRS